MVSYSRKYKEGDDIIRDIKVGGNVVGRLIILRDYHTESALDLSTLKVVRTRTQHLENRAVDVEVDGVCGGLFYERVDQNLSKIIACAKVAIAQHFNTPQGQERE